MPVRYWRAPDAAGDGWYYTGDLGRVDPDGRVYVLGRLKELVNRGGLKVSPSEVETAMARHPQVADAAVVATPTEDHADVGVRLLRAGVDLLVEKPLAVSLDGVDELEACEVVAGFYARLHVPALPRLQRLTTYIGRWTEQLARLPSDAPVPRRLVEQAVSLGRSFVEDEGTDAVMIHGDLHYQNVLAADREPWLVIDPKPMAGDPHYEVAPMLWNRWDEVVGSGNVRDAVRRRFHTIVDTAGLAEDRARDWVVVRELHNVLWTIEDAAAVNRRLDAEDREAITVAVSIAKAVQD
jgi:streptomycin 6-kinase